MWPWNGITGGNVHRRRRAARWPHPLPSSAPGPSRACGHAGLSGRDQRRSAAWVSITTTCSSLGAEREETRTWPEKKAMTKPGSEESCRSARQSRWRKTRRPCRSSGSPPWPRRPSRCPSRDEESPCAHRPRPNQAEERGSAPRRHATRSRRRPSARRLRAVPHDYIAVLREVAEDANPEIRESALGLLAAKRTDCPEEAARGAKESRQGAGASRKGASASQLRHPCGGVCDRADDRRKSLRTLRPSAKHCGCSRPTPSRRRYSRRCCATRTNCARTGRSRPSALHSLDPDKFQSHARAILVDKNEYDDIQATSLTALEQFGDDEAVAQDKKLLESVGRIGGKAVGRSTRRRQGTS